MRRIVLLSALALSLLSGRAAAAEPMNAAETPLTEQEAARATLFEEQAGAVVRVLVERRQFSQRQQVAGTGYFWDPEGYVITSRQILRDAQSIEVQLDDNSRRSAQLVDSDPASEIAVLKVNLDQPVSAVTLGNSAPLRVGQSVYTIGDPFGFGATFQAGMITGLGREISSSAGPVIANVIQTDLRLQPGDTGSPLYNRSGQLIGMNLAFSRPPDVETRVGLAIPVDLIRQVVPRLLDETEGGE